MLKIGFVRLLAIALFGIALPYVLHRLARKVGLDPLVAFAIFAGVSYGAIKADSAWSGDGLERNLLLMGTSALALVAGVSVWAASAIARLRF